MVSKIVTQLHQSGNKVEVWQCDVVMYVVTLSVKYQVKNHG